MVVECKAKKEVLCVKVEGRVDSGTAPEFEKILNENFSGIKAVEFDMKKLEYISSEGLRVLLKVKHQTGDEGYVLIKNMNDMVKNVFELTGFSEMFIMK